MKRHLLTVVSFVVFLCVGISLFATQGFLPQNRDTSEAAASLDHEAPVPDTLSSSLTTVKTRLRWGDNLASTLLQQGISRDEVNAVTPIVAHLLDLGKMRVGTRLQLGMDSEGLARLTIQEPGKLSSVHLSRTGPLLYVAQVEHPTLDTLLIRYEGTIDNSFYQSCLDNGGSDALAAAYYSVFRDVFYFNSETRKGDRYRMIVEEICENGVPVEYGRVLVADYQGVRGNYTAAWGPLEDADGGGNYFDRDGYSFRRALMQIPFEDRVAVRVTSRFGVRLHPISGKWRKHNGVDLAAPMGTPVLAAGDGVVIKVRRNDPGYGNWLQIRHPNGYETRYGHLSRFAGGMHVGMHVKQGQRIGNVGMTGYATGPHLHYEVFLNGKRMNPRSIKTSPVKKLNKDQLAVFLRDWYNPWVRELDHPGTLPSDRYFGPPLPDSPLARANDSPAENTPG